MSSPLITIITVAYNSEKFIAQTIKSVLSQSYQNFEYLILDDCSTDNTWSIINSFSDKRIIAIQNEYNLKEYGNRNKAIQLAKGSYIIFIDGDDIALKKGIELAVEEIEKYKSCGFGIVKPENPKFIGTIEITSKDGFNLEYFGGGLLNSSLTNNIYRTNILKENLFDENYKNADTFLRLNLLKKNNVLVLINPIGLWRISKNQASKKIDYSTQLLQQISFIKSAILTDSSFTLIDKTKLKTNYYKLIFTLIKQEFIKFHFINIVSMKKYFLDGFIKSLNYSFKKRDSSFWNEYNYENLNIRFD